MTETLNRVLRAKATEWGWRLLLMVITTIIGIMVAQGNAIQAAKDESANRRISGVESAVQALQSTVAALPEMQGQIDLITANADRCRTDRLAFQDRMEAKVDAIQVGQSDLAQQIAALTATINFLVRGTPGPTPTSLMAP